MRTLLPLAAAALLAPAAPAQLDSAADFAGFRRLFVPYGNSSAERTGELGPDGFRFRLAAKGGAGHLGLRAEPTIEGDFLLTASYEIEVTPPRVAEGYGAQTGLSVDAGGTAGTVSAFRLFLKDAAGPSFHAGRSALIAGKMHYGGADLPGAGPRGQLGLRRVGKNVRVLAANEREPLREIFRHDYTAAPIQSVNLYADTGGAPVEVRGRLFDVKLVTKNLPPEEPTASPSAKEMGRVPTVEQAKEQAKLEPDAEAPAGPAPQRSGALLPLAAFVAGAVFGVLLDRKVLTRKPEA